MEKKLNQMQLGIVKRIAQNVNGNFEKVAKLNEKIAALVEERDTLQTMIDEMEAPVVRMTGGYKSTDLYDKVIVPQFNEDGTPKLNDKTGYQVKTTKYVLKYPDTIVPPIVPPMVEDTKGTDYDLDGTENTEGTEDTAISDDTEEKAAEMPTNLNFNI